MRLGRRERVALIGLLLAAGALAADRLLLPAPGSAQASSSSELDSQVPPALILDDFLAPPPTQLAPDAPWTPAPDVFDLSRLAGPAVPDALRDASPDEDAVENFLRAHSLQATVLGPRPMALIGRRKVRVGETLDGFELTRVTDREAVFVSDRGTAVLRVIRPFDSP